MNPYSTLVWRSIQSLLARYVLIAYTYVFVKNSTKLTIDFKPVYGSLKSVEDHGYVINLGVDGTNAFIPKKFLIKKKKEGDEGEPEETKLIVGQLIDGLVSEVKKDTNTVFINPNADRVATKIVSISNLGLPYRTNISQTKEVSGLTLETLKPGMLVQAYIQAVLGDGLWVKFLGYFAGGISMYHLDKTYTSEEFGKAFKSGQKVSARILHVDPENKSVSLSMKTSIIQMEPFAFGKINVGDIFAEAVVRRIDAPIGVLLEIKSIEDDEPILGYAHVSNNPSTITWLTFCFAGLEIDRW